MTVACYTIPYRAAPYDAILYHHTHTHTIQYHATSHDTIPVQRSPQQQQQQQRQQKSLASGNPPPPCAFGRRRSSAKP